MVIDLSDFDDVLKKNLFEVISKDTNCRYMSWEHCYAFFYKNREKIIRDDDMLDLAALNLGFYLGNWGMFRKSFLMDKDYKIHVQVISRLLHECKELWQPYDKISWNDIKKANTIISKYYKSISKSKRVSKILISKILLGIFACVPAYDRYFMLAAKNSNGLVYHNYSERSYNDIKKVLSTLKYEHNEPLHDDEQITYPPMRLFDAYFWFKGKELDNGDKKQISGDTKK